MPARKRQKPNQEKEEKFVKKEEKFVKEKFVKWRKCPGRGILLEDLEPGSLLEDQQHRPAEALWRFYKTLPEFAGVPFAQFKKQLDKYVKNVGYGKEMAERDAKALRHDRAVHPRRSRNQRGELVFDMHVAKDLLQRDVKDGKHLTMKPSALRRTRPAYMEFSQTVFRHRIYQEVRRNKFLHYLDLKRAKLRPAPPRSKVDLLVKLLFEDLGIDDE
jgi:hypothetical protein